MISDSEVFQDLLNTFAIHGTLPWPVDVEQFLAGARQLREIGKERSSDPRQVLQCIQQMYRGVGPIYFRQLIDTPVDIDDMWVHYWCPQPKGLDLARADCPAGTVPLWWNGLQTVFMRPGRDKHGNEEFDFGVL